MVTAKLCGTAGGCRHSAGGASRLPSCQKISNQANRDFFAATTGKFNNNTRVQGIVLGQVFQW
jgi:hypothetical protein